MASIEEALSNIDESEYVRDTIQFVIDENLRTIAVPQQGVIFGVVGDKNVNIAHFQMVRYYKGFDLSSFNVRIYYINANDEINYYPVTDMESTEDTLKFTWLIGSNIMAYVGDVFFAVHMFVENDTEKKQVFNTTIASGKVLNGIPDVEDYIDPDREEDLLTKLQNKLMKYMQEKIDTLEIDFTKFIATEEEADAYLGLQ